MAEALAALGLVANIFQVVGFGLELTATGKEIYSSFHGASDENHTLEVIIQDIQNNTRQIQDALKSSHNLSSSDEKAILALAAEASPLSARILRMLNDLKVSKDARFRGLEAAKKAVRSAAKRKDIQDLQRQLQGLDTRLKRNLLQLLQEKSRSDILSEIRTLDRKHEQLRINTSFTLESLRADLTAAISPKPKSTSSQDVNYEQLVSRLKELATRASEMDNEQQILASLMYPSLKEREENIKDAHQLTLDWVLSNDDTQFSRWLSADSNIYWLKGKAGSGKSTLVKYISNHRRTTTLLEAWADPQRLVTASYFFWNAGLPMQKSQKGLLQSLLYQVLLASPDVIPKIAAQRKFGGEAWGRHELFEALQTISKETQLSAKYCFFIDGLDEYEGNDEDIINLLQQLASSNNIKLCISSRPWNTFLDAFENSEWNLKVEDFTGDDMRRYVHDLLVENEAFRKLADKDPRCEDLVPQIATKAQGVWLWVFLVVRDLLRDVKGEEEYEFLQRRLDNFPVELEEYFADMLNRIDRIYLEETSRIFLATVEAVRPLPLLAFKYLALQKDNPEYAVHLEVSPASPDEMEEHYFKWRKLLNSRCRDLLEITVNKDEPTFLKFKVDFLHRTVRDFLRDSYRSELIRKVHSGFDSTGVLSNILLALIKSLSITNDFRKQLDQVFSLADEMLHYAREQEVKTLKPNLLLLDELDRVCSIYASNSGSDTHWTNARDPPQPTATFKEYGQCDFLALAIQARLHLYVQEKLAYRNGGERLKSGRPYLDYALRPKRVMPESLPYQLQHQDTYIDVRTIRFFLHDLGVDPNQKVHLYNGQAIWQLFLQSCYANAALAPAYIKHAWLEAIELLIDHGALFNETFENPLDSESKRVGKRGRYKEDVLVETEPRMVSVDHALKRIFDDFEAQRLSRRIKEVEEQRRRQSGGFWKLLGWG